VNTICAAKGLQAKKRRGEKNSSTLKTRKTIGGSVWDSNRAIGNAVGFRSNTNRNLVVNKTKQSKAHQPRKGITALHKANKAKVPGKLMNTLIQVG